MTEMQNMFGIMDIKTHTTVTEKVITTEENPEIGLALAGTSSEEWEDPWWQEHDYNAIHVEQNTQATLPVGIPQ